MTGYTDEEIAAMDLAEFFPDETVPRVFDTIAEVIETGEATLRAPLLTKAGERRRHEFRGARLTGDDGEVRGICGIARDLSDCEYPGGARSSDAVAADDR